MKKTVKITIQGFSYHLDEDAYLALNDYLQAIGRQFASAEESKEVLDEVEGRIAEIFTDWLNEQKQVINLNDIHRLITIIGKPKDFITEEEQTQRENTTSQERPLHGKIFRDKDDAVFGGVCSGLASYFNFDAVLIRVLFVVLVLFFGLSLWVYIILWIVIPPAVTPEQRMEMKSRKYQSGKWKQKVSSEFEDIKTDPAYQGASNAASSIGKGLTEILHFVFRFIAVILGIGILLGGISLMIGFISAFVFAEPLSLSFFPHTDGMRSFVELFVRPGSLTLLTITSFLVVMLPIAGLIYLGLKLLLRFRTQSRTLLAVGITTWILSLLILIGTSLYEVKNYSFSQESDGAVAIEQTPEVLYIKKKEIPNSRIMRYDFFDADIEFVKSDKYPERIFWQVDTDITKAKDNSFSIAWEKTIRGYDLNSTADRNARVEFEWEMHGDTLFLPAYYYTEQLPPYRITEYDINIEIPETQIIYIEEGVESQLDYLYTKDYVSRYNMGGKYWQMQKDGLIEIEIEKK